MADNKISIFAISTYDTDYILVKDFETKKAIKIFEENDIPVLK